MHWSSRKKHICDSGNNADDTFSNYACWICPINVDYEVFHSTAVTGCKTYVLSSFYLGMHRSFNKLQYLHGTAELVSCLLKRQPKPVQWPCCLVIELTCASTEEFCVCVFERGQTILHAEWRISLWIFFPRDQFWFGNYVCIMFSALTNGVLQVLAQGWIWTHFISVYVKNRWHVVIFDLYFIFF